jgi:glucose/mannose-6-phosphate isomerase
MVADLDVNTPLASNRAKQLAIEIHGNIAVIYGAGVLSGVARRWKTQFNENSKNWAFFEVFPELIHNAVVGYRFPMQARKGIVALLLRSGLFHPRILVQYEAITEVLEDSDVDHKVIEAVGDNMLTQILSLILLGDFVSYYLAILNRTDPTPVATIDFVKKYLAGTEGR